MCFNGHEDLGHSRGSVVVGHEDPGRLSCSLMLIILIENLALQVELAFRPALPDCVPNPTSAVYQSDQHSTPQLFLIDMFGLFPTVSEILVE